MKCHSSVSTLYTLEIFKSLSQTSILPIMKIFSRVPTPKARRLASYKFAMLFRVHCSVSYLAYCGRDTISVLWTPLDVTWYPPIAQTTASRQISILSSQLVGAQLWERGETLLPATRVSQRVGNLESQFKLSLIFFNISRRMTPSLFSFMSLLRSFSKKGLLLREHAYEP